MPACDARYDVMLDDGSFRVWYAVARNNDRVTARLDFLEDRLPDDFGDPGPLVGAAFVRGINRLGQPVTQAFRGRFQIKGSGPLHRVYAHERRYLRWHLPDQDPEPDFDPEWIQPP